MTRTVKTDAQRAQEAFDASHRRLTKARQRRDKAKAEYDAAQAEVLAAERRHKHTAGDPDLPPVQQVDDYPALGDETAAGDDVRVS